MGGKTYLKWGEQSAGRWEDNAWFMAPGEKSLWVQNQQAGRWEPCCSTKTVLPIPVHPWRSPVSKARAQKCSKRAAGCGGSTDKWLQVSTAHSCRRLHDREQQLSGCQAMRSEDRRSATPGLPKPASGHLCARGLGMVWAGRTVVSSCPREPGTC